MNMVPFSPPDIREEDVQAVAEALRSGWITTGPRTKELERQLSRMCGTAKTACLNSATAALELTLRVLGVGPGDEVVTSAYTYTASASVIDHVGANIVLCDVEEGGYHLPAECLAPLITERTKAVIAVDIGGVPCDYDALLAVLEGKRGLFRPSNGIQEAFGRPVLIADAAHALGAVYKGKPVGSVADFTAFSFHAVKNLTTAEGGAATWRPVPGIADEALYREYMLWSLHGQDKDALAKNQAGGWRYDIKRLGYKCNMPDVLAALGLSQLARYDGTLQRRAEICRAYNEALADKTVDVLRHEAVWYKGTRHLYMARLRGADEARRDEAIRRLADCGVTANVHYIPLPMHTAYREKGFDIAAYPNAFAQYQNEISLPVFSGMTEAELETVVDAIGTVM